MAGATKYVDNVLGSDLNSGNAPGSGNAYATIAYAVSQISGGGNTIYARNTGTVYPGNNTLTAGLKGDTTDGRNRLEGYTTTPGARDGRPTVTSGSASQALFILNDNDFWDFVHLNLTHSGSPRGLGFSCVTSASDGVRFIDLVVDGCLAVHTQASNLIPFTCFIDCEVARCTSTAGSLSSGSNGTVIAGCYVHDNLGDGYRGAGSTVYGLVMNSIFANNAGTGFNSVSTSVSGNYQVLGSLFVGNGADGVAFAATAGTPAYAFANNVFYGNTGYGIDHADTTIKMDLGLRFNRCNAYGAPGLGDRNNVPAGTGDVGLSADPFVNRTGGNFAPNATAGGGTALRAAGFPHAYPGGTTTGYADIGVQHQDASGASGVAYW